MKSKAIKGKTFRENIIRALNRLVVFIMDTLTKNWGWFNEVQSY